MHKGLLSPPTPFPHLYFLFLAASSVPLEISVDVSVFFVVKWGGVDSSQILQEGREQGGGLGRSSAAVPIGGGGTGIGLACSQLLPFCWGCKKNHLATRNCSKPWDRFEARRVRQIFQKYCCRLLYLIENRPRSSWFERFYFFFPRRPGDRSSALVTAINAHTNSHAEVKTSFLGRRLQE